MDTNGRRSDVLNALKIYLEILEELKEVYPTESWGTYPDSLSQFLFYEKALEKSKDVFKIHSNYDNFISELGAMTIKHSLIEMVSGLKTISLSLPKS